MENVEVWYIQLHCHCTQPDCSIVKIERKKRLWYSIKISKIPPWINLLSSTVPGGKFDSNLCCFTYSYICISFILLRNWSSLMTCLGRRLAHFRAQWGKILYAVALHSVPESLYSFQFSRISVFYNRKFKKNHEIAEFIPNQLRFHEKNFS